MDGTYPSDIDIDVVCHHAFDIFCPFGLAVDKWTHDQEQVTHTIAAFPWNLLKVFPRKWYDSAVCSSKALGDLVVDFARLGRFYHEDLHRLVGSITSDCTHKLLA